MYYTFISMFEIRRRYGSSSHFKGYLGEMVLIHLQNINRKIIHTSIIIYVYY